MLLPIPPSLASSLEETSSVYFSPLAQPSPKRCALYWVAGWCLRTPPQGSEIRFWCLRNPSKKKRLLFHTRCPRGCQQGHTMILWGFRAGWVTDTKRFEEGGDRFSPRMWHSFNFWFLVRSMQGWGGGGKPQCCSDSLALHQGNRGTGNGRRALLGPAYIYAYNMLKRTTASVCVIGAEQYLLYKETPWRVWWHQCPPGVGAH